MVRYFCEEENVSSDEVVVVDSKVVPSGGDSSGGGGGGGGSGGASFGGGDPGDSQESFFERGKISTRTGLLRNDSGFLGDGFQEGSFLEEGFTDKIEDESLWALLLAIIGALIRVFADKKLRKKILG